MLNITSENLRFRCRDFWSENWCKSCSTCSSSSLCAIWLSASHSSFSSSSILAIIRANSSSSSACFVITDPEELEESCSSGPEKQLIPTFYLTWSNKGHKSIKPRELTTDLEESPDSLIYVYIFKYIEVTTRYLSLIPTRWVSMLIVMYATKCSK